MNPFLATSSLLLGNIHYRIIFVSTDIIFFLLPTIDFYRYWAFICLQLLVIVFSREVQHIENSHTPHKVLRRTMHTYRFHSHRHRSHTAPGRYLLASAYAFACTPEITHLYCVLHTNLRRKLFQTTQDRSGDSTESTTVLRVALNFAVHAFIFSIIIFLLLLVLDSINSWFHLSAALATSFLISLDAWYLQLTITCVTWFVQINGLAASTSSHRLADQASGFCDVLRVMNAYCNSLSSEARILSFVHFQFLFL